VERIEPGPWAEDTTSIHSLRCGDGKTNGFCPCMHSPHEPSALKFILDAGNGIPTTVHIHTPYRCRVVPDARLRRDLQPD
jgi:hypothetical protein